jgi:hypothetical protein
MAVSVEINGTALNPQPRSATWDLAGEGGKLNGTDHLGAYDIMVLRSPPSRGGTANWNWSTFENQVLTSIKTVPRGQTLKSGTAATYSAGVVSKPIMSIVSPPGDTIEAVEFRVLVIV